MKKKMINLFLIIISLGCLSLAFSWHEYHKKNSEPNFNNAIAQISTAPPNTMTQFLRGHF